MAAMLPWRLRKNTFPLAAGDVFFDTPIMSAFAATVINALPMWRKNVGRHALDDLRTRLIEQHSSYILFPEGRRSANGPGLQHNGPEQLHQHHVADHL